MSAYRSKGGKLVPLTEVRVNAIWQQPLHINDEKVKSFASLMETGCEFDPIQVIQRQDGCYEVREGHHRFMASQRCSFTHIPVEIIPLPSAIAQKLRQLRDVSRDPPRLVARGRIYAAPIRSSCCSPGIYMPIKLG